MCDDVSMPECDSCHAFVTVDLAFTPPWGRDNECCFAPEVKPLEKDEQESKHPVFHNMVTLI